MATTQIGLVLIATTLVTIAVFCWSLLYYVPLLLDGDDHAEDVSADVGRPS